MVQHAYGNPSLKVFEFKHFNVNEHVPFSPNCFISMFGNLTIVNHGGIYMFFKHKFVLIPWENKLVHDPKHKSFDAARYHQLRYRSRSKFE